MKTRYLVVLATLLVLLFGLSNALFVVADNEYGVLLRFGQVVDAGLAPGLHVMIPLADDVRRLDARVQVSDGESGVLNTTDKQSLVLDSYALWRIVNPRQFYAATGGGGHETDVLLQALLGDTLASTVTRHTLAEALAGDPSLVVSPALDAAARRQLGITILELRVRRVRYPDSLLDAVHQRMSTVFQAEAAGIAAEGKSNADIVRANAERDSRTIVADARQQADALRGQGDGGAAAITSRAVGGDAEFYRFYRSLEAYRTSLSKPGDVLILRADDEFLKYLQPPAGK